MRALELDEALPDAWIAMALVHWFHHWDLAACRRDLGRALDLSPNDPTAHWVLSTVLSVMLEDQDVAIAEASAAEEFDPLSTAIRSTTGWIHYWSRQFDRAIAHMRKTIEMDECCFHAWCVAGVASMAKSSFEDAIANLERACAIGGDNLSLSFLAMAYGLAGRREQASAALRRLEAPAASHHVAPMCLVFALMGLGENERALDLLEKMYEEHDSQILMLQVSPIYDTLRPNARFGRLVSKTGLWPPV